MPRGQNNATKTHCPQGHPYSAANTYVIPSTGGRMCRTCLADRLVNGYEWANCQTCAKHRAGCWDLSDDPTDRAAHLRAWHRKHVRDESGEYE